jgi:spore cortex formation protein SpoVR/YcgB (stage V sporulation)
LKKDNLAKFQKLLDALESHLDSGFFLSFMGKIVVDEKKIYSTLNEMRSMRIEMEAEEKEESAKQTAEKMVSPEGTGKGDIGAGAEMYALQTLDNLEQTLHKVMSSVKEGRKYLERKMEREVKEDGASEI